MYYVLISHSVTDYHIWKTGFDSAAKLRKEAGEIEYYVLTHDDNVNNVVHFSRWKSHDAARSFFESDSIKQIRASLGVQQPEFIYLNALENGIL